MVSLFLALMLLLATGCGDGDLATDPDPGPGSGPARSLGDVRLLSGPTACDGEDCYEVEVSCPELAESESATLKVGEQTGAPSRGTILFTTGGGGTGLWENYGAEAGRVLGELRAAGFRTVQLQWARGWLQGAPGQLEGQARLACKPATVARWVYDNLHDRVPEQAFCATGNSGGAGQVSYMVAQYGLSEILSAVVPTGGPPFGRIDRGCLPEGPADQLLAYEPSSAQTVDQGFGFLQGGSGPCSRQDASFSQRFQEASVAFGDWPYVYPRTMVWFLFGENDDTSAVEQGQAFYERLVQEGSPLIRMTIVPDTPHATPSTSQGAEMIRDIILDECIPR